MESVSAYGMRGLQLDDLQGPFHPKHSMILWFKKEEENGETWPERQRVLEI